MAEGDLIQTGIAGLDDILRSSIPKGNVILVEGAAGTGKTLLGMEFIYRGVTGRGHYLYSHPATSGGRGRRDAVKRSTNFRAQRLVLLQGRLNRLGAGLAPGCFAVWRGMLDLGVDLSPYQ
jgi:predicted ATP-dependent serine protease